MENGIESKPSEENAAAEETVDRNSKEAEEDAKYTAAAEEDVDKRKSPELPIPELVDLPSTNAEDKRENLTDDEGQFTPSGTLSRHGHIDE